MVAKPPTTTLPKRVNQNLAVQEKQAIQRQYVTQIEGIKDKFSKQKYRFPINIFGKSNECSYLTPPGVPCPITLKNATLGSRLAKCLRS